MGRTEAKDVDGNSKPVLVRTVSMLVTKQRNITD